MKQNRVLRWLFQRSKPKRQQATPITSAWVVERKRLMIGDDEGDITEQPTLILPVIGAIDHNAPTVAEPAWRLYCTETVAIPSCPAGHNATVPVMK